MDSTFISVFGYLPNGRQVSVQFPSGGDLQRDLSMAQLVNDEMSKGGFSALPPTPGEGEKSEIVHYILRSSSENAKGKSVVLYLYTERFSKRFLKMYINNAQDKAAFEQAFGVALDSAPYYSSEDQAFDRKEAPNKAAQYLFRVPFPVRVYFKPNPAYNPDEPDIKKRKPKYHFVRWGEREGGQPAQTAPRQTAGQTAQTGGNASVRSDRQTTDRQTENPFNQGRQTGQTTPRQTTQTGQTNGVGQSQWKRSPDETRRMGGTQPPRAANPVQQGNNRSEVIDKVWRSHDERQRPYIMTANKSYTWTREKFEEAGINIPDNFFGQFDLGGSYTVLSTQDDSGYWHITGVIPVGQHEAELFGPPPQADFSFMDNISEGVDFP